MNILIVEDDSVIREGVAEFLQQQNHQVFSAADGEAGLEIFRTHTIHLMILDVMLPKMSGIELLREVRKSSGIPALMLTAVTDEETQIQSFDSLADDYMCKPFSLILLQKRLEALLRRHYGQHSVWEYGGAVVDFSGCHATYEGKDAQVKLKEIKLLEFLLRHPGQVMTREQILDEIWEKGEAPYDRVIDVYVTNLRKKLHLDCIVTVKGMGYKVVL